MQRAQAAMKIVATRGCDCAHQQCPSTGNAQDQAMAQRSVPPRRGKPALYLLWRPRLQPGGPRKHRQGRWHKDARLHDFPTVL